MKTILLACCILLGKVAFSQTKLPNILEGTWKMEDKDNYEHWDILNDNSMQGMGYSLKNGKMRVSEYLQIALRGDTFAYTATVVRQNQGKHIDFLLRSSSDSVFVFENPMHDFPKRITYNLLTHDKIRVEISDGDKKVYSLTFLRQ